MKNLIYITGLVAIIMLSSGSSFAQSAKTKMAGMKHNSEMSEMMKTAHHKVVMAYRQNVLTMAKTLRDLAKSSAPLNADFARALSAEIKRGSEMMNKVRKNHMRTMSSEKLQKMAPMMAKMKKQNAELGSHIAALGVSVRMASIDSKAVENHAAAIIAALEMRKMNKPHKAKMKIAMKHM